MLWSTTIFFLVLSYYDRCAFGELIPSGRNVSDNDVDNAITEVFQKCKCVYYYQCDSNNYIITSGENIFNVRTQQVATRIFCKGLYEGEKVCCRLRPGNETAKPLIKSPDEIVGVIETDKNKNETDSAKLTKKTSCGIQKPILNVRIFTGENELTPVAGEFPWISAIYRQETPSDPYKFHCSGSLIHPKVVVTAEHCVYRKKANTFKVIINGEIKLPDIGNDTHQERSVTEIVHHPEYYAGALYNDVALLILDKPYNASKQHRVNTICLPPSDIKLDNIRCLVAGFGKDEQGENLKIMKKVELPFVNFDRCQELLRQTSLGTRFKLHTSFMCAGGEEGKDACKGDGGSPLICQFPSENRYFQIGIVSWGIGCGQVNVPGVYGSVQVFSDWIKTELQHRELDL